VKFYFDTYKGCMSRAVERQHVCVGMDPEILLTLLHSITSVPGGTLKLKNPYIIISQTEDSKKKTKNLPNVCMRIYGFHHYLQFQRYLGSHK
jgi:hypothetical protein